MMKARRQPWPNPQDTALDRARRVARQYRQALAEADPARCAAIDTAANLLGESWVAPTVVTTDEAWVTAHELAEMVGVKVGTVYVWVQRGVIPIPVEGRHNLREAQDALRNRRLRKAS